jgi:hypothetical protein
MSVETTALPDGITEDNVRPVVSWRHHASPLSLVIFGLVVFAALSGALGHERTWVAAAGSAELEVHAPEVIRNGEFFEMRVRLQAAEPIAELAIGIDESLWEDMTVNTMIPAAAEETSANGEARFTFAELPAGTTFLFKIDLQVNPDILGGNEGTVTLYDGETELAATELSITVLP